ncbi:formate dehydrogenase subunit alpha [Mucilaginibacter gossypii]|uniref:formate dehydrogenase subunit alpha n=1 Tax=Mucilaginibacter gossypii TaxID=551996 RepID=UPI000DCAEC6F|nr:MULTISPECIES: formate dehydrogenase subunit alpha [Mucilaginibacter]QTE34892.1 formate dehydrogenase subunit alpha [Mucilaginibacter gossypii]RAV59590.1 formate dehydrogenase subunit alpha [Mucilaginibacter rubeus]
MYSVIINNKEHHGEAGQTILNLLHRIGVDVPALCYDERLHPFSVCRSCLVKVKGQDQLQPACRTLLTDKMVVETHTSEIEDYRKGILQMLARDYPFSEVTRFPQKEFHQWLKHYGITEETKNTTTPVIDSSHPYMQVDMGRCINCSRCVKICDELQGQFVWHIINRGDKTKIISDSKSLFAESSCVSCGACADACPTGAIEDKQAIKLGTPDEITRSVCAYCGVGCEIEIGVKEQKIVGVHPAKNALVNKGHLCVKGRYAWEYMYAGDRITQPMIRCAGKWKKASWDEAIKYCAERLTSISKKHGADSISIIGSARATNEDNYCIQKFARAVIGTNNVDNCARVCHQPTAKAMSMVLGTGVSTNSFDDIERAKTILVAGADTTESHPVVGARIKQAAIKGANLIVIDPRRTELAEYATFHLQLKPGTNIPLFHAMAHVIVSEKLHNEEFIINRTEGWDEFKKFIAEWTPERAAKICGVHPRLIRESARLFTQKSPSMCFHGLGLTEHTQGTENVMALITIALLTGNIGKEGAGINPLRGQNNVQGSAVMGCDPAVYTGMASVKTERKRFEELWKTDLPATRGLTLPEMLDAAVTGDLKAMWIIGYDVFFTMPNSKHTKEAFDMLDFIIVQDMFMNETAKKFADVFLPCASSFEKEGTFMNAERRIQKVRAAVSRPQEVKADWEVVCIMAAAMKKKELFNFSSAQDIWNEIRDTWSAAYGITYERLDNNGIQWPCPTTDHPGTTILHTETFPREGGRAKLSIIEFCPTPEQVTPAYPFILITGRTLYHFNAGNMTYRTANKDICRADLLHLNPKDANIIGLQDGDTARVVSKYGEASLTVCIDKSLNKGEAFSTFNDARVFINKITSPLRDKYVQTPEYKITAVRIEKWSA